MNTGWWGLGMSCRERLAEQRLLAGLHLRVVGICFVSVAEQMRKTVRDDHRHTLLPHDVPTSPSLGRPWKHGGWQCFSVRRAPALQIFHAQHQIPQVYLSQVDMLIGYSFWLRLRLQLWLLLGGQQAKRQDVRRRVEALQKIQSPRTAPPASV